MGLKPDAISRFLKLLEESGNIEIGRTDNEIANVRVLRAPVEMLSAKESAAVTGKLVVVVVDMDNICITAKQTMSLDLNPEEVCEAVLHYSRKLGEVARAEVHVTSKSDGLIKIVYACHQKGVSVVVSPPLPNAADKRMIDTLNFGLNCPNVKYIVIASNDAKAFKPFCSKALASGREAHLLTPGSSVGGLMGASTKCTSLISVMGGVKKDASPVASRKLEMDISNKFTLPVLRFKEGRVKYDKTSETADFFVLACSQAISEILKTPEDWRTFNRLAEDVWSHVNRLWEPRGFKFFDARKVLSAFVSVDLLKSEEREISGKMITVYHL